MFFGEKRAQFRIYPTTSCFSKITQKVELPLEIPFYLIFFQKHKVVPLSFFQILIKTQNQKKPKGIPYDL